MRIKQKSLNNTNWTEDKINHNIYQGLIRTAWVKVSKVALNIA